MAKKRNGKAKTPSYKEGELRDPSIKEMQAKDFRREELDNLIRQASRPHKTVNLSE